MPSPTIQPVSSLWDARAPMDLGVLIARYLNENPPPADSEFAPRLVRIAQDLRALGEESLLTSGVARLRLTS